MRGCQRQGFPAIVRSGLRQFFSEHVDLRAAGEAASGREAIGLVRTTELDVLVMDLSMPGQSGIDALAMIRAKAPDVGIHWTEHLALRQAWRFPPATKAIKAAAVQPVVAPTPGSPSQPEAQALGVGQQGQPRAIANHACATKWPLLFARPIRVETSACLLFQLAIGPAFEPRGAPIPMITSRLSDIRPHLRRPSSVKGWKGKRDQAGRCRLRSVRPAESAARAS
jgi:CheY-like chemotaxis protein